jgi:hypothetical protein
MFPGSSLARGKHDHGNRGKIHGCSDFLTEPVAMHIRELIGGQNHVGRPFAYGGQGLGAAVHNANNIACILQNGGRIPGDVFVLVNEDDGGGCTHAGFLGAPKVMLSAGKR